MKELGRDITTNAIGAKIRVVEKGTRHKKLDTGNWVGNVRGEIGVKR